MKYLILILIVSLYSCGGSSIDVQIKDYTDSVKYYSEEYAKVIDSPYPETDSGVIRRKTKLQILEIKRSYFKELIADLEKKR